MIVEQIYTSCLAQGAYYIESQGEAVIIDPLREVQPYINKAKKNNAHIKYILETHFHADFVSGHIDLARKTGATIVFGPNANTSFDAYNATDGEILKVGNVKIKVLHTPGHTMESTTYLLIDENDKDYAIFTGDTLFLGDVGRPDLAQKGENMTQEDLAGILFDSLRQKIMPLADNIIVYPGHGAGSACGKSMMKETIDTLGNQKAMNYALRADMSKEEFIKEVTEGLLPPPAYFPINAKMNKEGYDSFEQVLQKGLTPLTPDLFEALANQQSALILDTRHQRDFVAQHIPGAIFIGLNGSFAPWVGTLISNVQQAILLVTEEGKEEEAVTRLARVGYDNTLGYLQGGINAWQKAAKATDSMHSISAISFEKNYTDNNKIPLFDVRKEGEYQASHVKEAKHTPLSLINKHMVDFPKSEPFYLHCAGGYRSVIAASILKARGFHAVVNIEGGYKAMQATNIPTTEFVCPTSIH